MKRKSKKQLITSIVLLAVLVIGIGYAYLTSNLSISGTTEIANNSWDIHFENLNVKDGSVTASTPATIQSNNVDITYAITLNRPKEYYEFTVDVKNDGTLPGKVSISSLSGLDTTSSKVIDYTITYTNGNPVNVGDILNAGASKTIKVRVFYKDNISSTDLPSTNLHIDLTYTLVFNQSDNIESFSLFDRIMELAETNTCLSKYNGNVTDEVGNTKAATQVYFDKCLDNRNIIFGGFCWQIIRTTETGGIKMMYNGEPLNNKCESTRTSHNILKTSTYYTSFDEEYTYGNSFVYDENQGQLRLINTFKSTLSNETSSDLIGKYTCKSSENNCTTLYRLDNFYSPSSANVTIYSVTSTHYSQATTSAYNIGYYSPAMVGYMYNKVYNRNYKTPGTTEYMFSSSYSYDNGNNTYTLSGTVNNTNNWSNDYNTINNTHYTCWNTSGNCNTLSYVYYTDSNYGYYMDLTNGKTINEMINEMLYSNDVNLNNSTIKTAVDYWYKQYLNAYTFKLEDVVFCNARDTYSLGGWNPNGGNTTSYLRFKNYNAVTNLSCANITDQFAMSNNKAKLTYPVALLQEEERNNINNTSLLKTGNAYWEMSPYYFYSYTMVRGINYNGNSYNDTGGTYSERGVRPVVSLKNSTRYISGTGSETDPWIID